MPARASVLFLLPAIVLLALSAACGGGDDSSSEAPSPAAPARPGWKSFDKPGFSGQAAPAWKVAVLGREEYLKLAERGLAALDLDSVETVLEGLETSETILLVMMDQDQKFANNINVQPCFPGEQQRSGKETVDLYREEAGIAAEVVSRVRYLDRDYDLIQARFYEQVDTYQAWVGDGDCVSIVTLTVRKGETSPLDDLRAFLAALEVDED